MRRTLGIAAAAVLAAGMASLPVTTASGNSERAPDGRTAAAIRALTNHPGAARAADGQSFQVKNTLVELPCSLVELVETTDEGPHRMNSGAALRVCGVRARRSP